ncbi:MAG: hypothetical protein JOZ78_13760 [Chroococcidiopsidaceae cyanobacterium CP_BM_ER_R8_30]|nr:hypothetical protein [Chroococcidiopsidaceae cyanobacterium CP_BM_ER_R8_30]
MVETEDQQRIAPRSDVLRKIFGDKPILLLMEAFSMLSAIFEDFRWQQGWLSIVKIFRQNYPQWEPVLDEVIEQLKVRIEN